MQRSPPDDIRWADVILVMEPKHKQRLQAEFWQLVNYKRIEVLNILDDYKYMDPELVDIFEAEAEAFLGAIVTFTAN